MMVNLNKSDYQTNEIKFEKKSVKLYKKNL